MAIRVKSYLVKVLFTFDLDVITCPHKVCLFSERLPGWSGVMVTSAANYSGVSQSLYVMSQLMKWTQYFSSDTPVISDSGSGVRADNGVS